MNRGLVRWLAILLLLVFGQWMLGVGTAGARSAADFAAGEILVKFKPGTSGAAIADAHRQNGGRVKEVIPGIDVQVVGVAAGQEMGRVAAYTRNPNVQFAEVNGVYQAIGATNDPMVGRQWQYNNTGQELG